MLMLGGAFRSLLADTLTVERVEAAFIEARAQIACCWLRLAVSVIAFESLRLRRTQRDVKSLPSSVDSCMSWMFEFPRAGLLVVVLLAYQWYAVGEFHGCGIRATRAYI